MSGVSLILALFIKSRGRVNANCFMTAWRPEYTPRGPQVRELQVITREQNYSGSAHRRSHRRGPPYRDSAIAAPTHNYFSLNSQFTGASTPPGPYSSARRQYTSRVPPEYPAGAAHLKRLPRVAHLRAARPQARGDEEPTGKPRPSGSLVRQLHKSRLPRGNGSIGRVCPKKWIAINELTKLEKV